MLKHFKIFLYGALVGIFELIPGISGSTIAYLLKIYKRLIFSISNINFSNFKKILFNLSKPKSLNEIFIKNDFYFLIFYVFGMFLSVFLFSKIIHYFIIHHKKNLLIFFLIILIISFLFFLKNFKFKIQNSYLLILGVLITIILSSFSTNIHLNILTLFILGFFISIFGILPGISGSQMLLIFGVYEELIFKINNFEIFDIFFFCIGAFFGILICVFFIKKLLKKYELKTYTFILGLIIGSIIILIKNLFYI